MKGSFPHGLPQCCGPNELTREAVTIQRRALGSDSTASHGLLGSPAFDMDLMASASQLSEALKPHQVIKLQGCQKKKKEKEKEKKIKL